MRRLAIIDLAGGHQPIANEDGSVVVVLNGEIYNYRELRDELKARGHDFRSRSDTEVIVHLYEEHGTELLRHLRGMFSFAVWDERRKRLLLARDRLGKKPLYYCLTRDAVFFASEIKALVPLLKKKGISLTVRERSIYDFLSLAVVPQPWTIYNEIQSLPAASQLIFENDRVQFHKYWSLERRSKSTLARDELLQTTRDLIAESTRLRLRSDVPVGLFLSGGLDSSIVAYEAARSGANVETFTVSQGDAEYDESDIARRTSIALGLKNTTIPLEVSPLRALEKLVAHFDQPFADPSAIPSFEISRLAREHVKVVLNGDGGDELFAGYRRHLAVYLTQATRWMPSFLKSGISNWVRKRSGGRRSTSGFASRFMRGLELPLGSRYIVWSTDMVLESDKRLAWLGRRQQSTESWIEDTQQHGLSAIDTLLNTEIDIHLPSMLLVKMDMATMANSVEARSPLLDQDLATFAATIPSRYLFQGLRTKSLLRDAYARHLSQEVVLGRKRGFEIPLERWLTGELSAVLMDVLGSRAAKVRTYLDGAFVDGLLDRKILQERNWPYLVYSLLVLELWLRFQDSEGQAHRL